MQRKIKTLMAWYGVSKEEIAERLEVSVSSVEKKLRGANRWWLQEALEVSNIFAERGHEESIEELFELVNERETTLTLSR